MVIIMEKEKKGSWAVLKQEEVDEDNNQEIETMVAADKAQYTFQTELLKILYRIAVALEEGNEIYRVANSIESVEVTEEVPTIEDDDTSTSASVKSSVSMTPIPTNLKSESDIINYYSKILSDLKTSSNTPLLDQVIMDKVEIRVGEDMVWLKVPYMPAEKYPDAFRVVARTMDKLGGRYIKDGSNTHYEMPKPVIP